MKLYKIFIDKSPVGPLTVIAEDNYIISLQFGKLEVQLYNNRPICEKANAILAEAEKQLSEYFSGSRKDFELPLKLYGTKFQKKVWTALCTVEYGKTATYKELAELAGNAGAARAVGQANHNNPISIIVPCHRIIGSNGSLTGYGGGIDKKRILLDLECRYL